MIAPRTPGGQALSIVYAVIGIPLVLAILSHFGSMLTWMVSALWMRYRDVLHSWAEKDPDGRGKYIRPVISRKSTSFSPPDRSVAPLKRVFFAFPGRVLSAIGRPFSMFETN